VNLFASEEEQQAHEHLFEQDKAFAIFVELCFELP